MHPQVIKINEGRIKVNVEMFDFENLQRRYADTGYLIVFISFSMDLPCHDEHFVSDWPGIMNCPAVGSITVAGYVLSPSSILCGLLLI